MPVQSPFMVLLSEQNWLLEVRDRLAADGKLVFQVVLAPGRIGRVFGLREQSFHRSGTRLRKRQGDRFQRGFVASRFGIEPWIMSAAVYRQPNRHSVSDAPGRRDADLLRFGVRHRPLESAGISFSWQDTNRKFFQVKAIVAF